VIECSLGDTETLTRAATGTGAVVYCAGTVRGRSLEDFLPANVTGVQNMLQALAPQRPAVPFLLISSLAASRPGLSHYCRSKYLGEQAVREQTHTPWTILRPPAVYGPGDVEMAPLLRMARRGVMIRPGPTNQRLSLLYADDLATAVLAWLGHWQNCLGLTCDIDDGRTGGYDWPAIASAAGHEKFLSLPVPFPLLASIARINELISGLVGYAPMLSPGKVRELTQPDWLCDNTAFVRATGWQPQTGLREGIRLSLDGDSAPGLSPRSGE
jgi:nucleoside-diphosphate-sugar epimerase